MISGVPANLAIVPTIVCPDKAIGPPTLVDLEHRAIARAISAGQVLRETAPVTSGVLASRAIELILVGRANLISAGRAESAITFKICPRAFVIPMRGTIGGNDHIGDVGDWWQNNWGDYGGWYGDDWWHDHDIHWPYYPGFGYWAGAAWGSLSGWVDYGWSDPVYYNYGDNVYYEDDSVYYGDQPVCTELQYIEQAEAIAESQPETKPEAKDWMPLGVFAITQDGEPTGVEPTMFLQLAVSKQGVINGTFQNTATNSVKAVEGMVDKETQRAAWTAVGESRPLMEVGVVNLTKDATAALIHFPDNSTQQWLFVRLEKPGSTTTSTPSK